MISTSIVGPKKVSNAWGRDQIVKYEHFQIEASDVGRRLLHWGGHNHRDRVIGKDDVGRTFVLTTMPADPTYRCWGLYEPGVPQ